MKSLIIILSMSFSMQIMTSQINNDIALQKSICTGWNTWSYGSMLSHVLLPEGLSLKINLRQSFIGTPGDRDYFVDEFTVDTPGLVRPIAHSYDGSYTELMIRNWKGNSIRVQSAAKGKDIVILITPVEKSPNLHYNIELETGILWNREGSIKSTGETITAKFRDSEYIIRSTGRYVETYQPYSSPYLAFRGDTAISFYTGAAKSLSEIKSIIDNAENDYHKYAIKYGKLANGFEAIQSVIGNNSMFDMADVRLNSLYTSDCLYLAKIAAELGKTDEVKVLNDRAAHFKKMTQLLWNEKSGIFLNWFPGEKTFSERLSPTLFYPMVAGIPTQEQAARMNNEHLNNINEFYSRYMLPSCSFNDKSYDNNYWRGAIWGPMNFLVYLGLLEYDKKAAGELAEKSYGMFIRAWEKNGAVLENINSRKGPDNLKDQLNFAPFYHWGALMGILMLMERKCINSARNQNNQWIAHFNNLIQAEPQPTSV